MMPYAETSRAAWSEQSSENRDRQRGRILDALESVGGEGMTSDEVESCLGIPHQTASAYLSHLRRDRLILDSGKRRTTRHGRAAAAWIIRPEPSTPAEIWNDLQDRRREAKNDAGRAARRLAELDAVIAGIDSEAAEFIAENITELTNGGMSKSSPPPS